MSPAAVADLIANKTVYRSIVVGDAPLAYWRLGETAGTMADQIAGAHPLTLNGTISRGASGLLAGDPLQSGCSVAQPAGLNYCYSGATAFFANLAGALSIEGWVKLSALPQLASLARFGQFTDLQYQLAITTTGALSYGWYDGAFRAVSTGNGLIVVGTLYHVAMTRAADGVTVGLYVNGVKTAVTAPSIPTPATAAQILTLLAIQAGSQQMNGSGQDFAIYNYELTAAQVKSHFLAGSVPLAAASAATDGLATRATYRSLVLADAPVGYYRLNDVGNVAADSSGNALDGAISGYADLVKSKGSSLVAYWRFEEAAGVLVAADSSGNGRNGTITGNVALGNRGPLADPDLAAVFFGGALITTPAINLSQGDWTMEAWVFPTSFPQGHNQIFSGGVGAVAIDMSSSGALFATEVSVNDAPGAGFTVPLNAWTHIVISFVLATKVISYYANGTLISAPTWAGFNQGLGAANSRIGSTSSYASQFLGAMDEVAVYTTILTAAEVLTHYNAGKVTRPVVRGIAGAIDDGTSAMTFDGAVGYVGFPALAYSTTLLTLEAWVNHQGQAWNASYEVVVGIAVPTYLAVLNGVPLFSCDASGQQQLSAPSGLSTSGWHHLVGTIDAAGTMRLYVDGVQVNSVATAGGTITSTSGAGRIGQWVNNGLFFNGSIDEVAIYPTALSAALILNRYNAGRAVVAAGSATTDIAALQAIYKAVILSDQPVGYWRLDDVGNVASDSSGNGYAGTVSGYADFIKARAGLVGYWRLEEAAGLVAVDSSGNGHTGAISATGVILGGAGPLLDPDLAMTFDGATGLITTDNTGNAFDFTTQFSLELWVKLAAPSVQVGVVGKYQGDQTGWDLSVVAGVSGGRPRLTVRGTSNLDTANLAGPPSVCDGFWHHIVCTVTTTTLLMYVDGQLVQTVNGTWTATTNARPVVIGGRQAASFPGAVDEVAIYNIVLTSAEILAHYNAGVITRPVARGGAGPIGDGDTAMTFDGVSGVVQNTTLTGITTQVSMEAWFNVPVIPSGLAIMGQHQGINALFIILQPGPSFQFRTSSDAGLTAFGTPNLPSIVVGTWHHVVATYDGFVRCVYLDGTLVATDSGQANWKTPQTGWGIGTRYSDAVNLAWLGLIDEAAVYSYALSAAKVRNHYNAGLQKIGALAAVKDVAV